MHPRRQARFNELVSQTVSRLIPTLKDPALGFITITGAEVSPDVSLAKIFFSVYGTDEEKEGTKIALERAKPYIRRELAKLENMRKVPQLHFIYDRGVENADRVNRILHALEHENDDTNPH